jgi:hypothetical protein
MGSVAFSTVFLFLPTLAEKTVEFQFGLAASSLMMEFQLIPDFDNESNYAPGRQESGPKRLQVKMPSREQLPSITSRVIFP